MYLTQSAPQGKYGVAIVWSDGHFATIYTFDALENIAARVAAM